MKTNDQLKAMPLVDLDDLRTLIDAIIARLPQRFAVPDSRIEFQFSSHHERIAALEARLPPLPAPAALKAGQIVQFTERGVEIVTPQLDPFTVELQSLLFKLNLNFDGGHGHIVKSFERVYQMGIEAGRAGR